MPLYSYRFLLKTSNFEIGVFSAYVLSRFTEKIGGIILGTFRKFFKLFLGNIL